MLQNSCICVSTEKLSVENFPGYLKNYILEGINNKEKVVIITDTIYCKELEKIFNKDYDYVKKNITEKNILMEIYDSNNYISKILPHLMESFIDNHYNNCRILWDLKNILKKKEALEESIYYIRNILNTSLFNNIKSVVYMNNTRYQGDIFETFCKEFNTLVVCDKGRELYFNGKEEIEKASYFLQSYAEVKSQNRNLVLFNETMLNIPKGEFKSSIINKLRDVCDLDFCVVCTAEKIKENILSLDSCFGVTKKHKYYMMNDIDVIRLEKDLNEQVLSTGNSVFIETSNMEGLLKDKLSEIGILCIMGINVEYGDDMRGVIWVGRYTASNSLSKDSLEYIESICRTLFYLLIEHEKFFELQKKFLENEKLRVVGEMSAGIAHDINNILTPVIGSVQLLKDKFNKDRAIIKHLDIIEMCTYDATNITNKIKKLTKNYNEINKKEIFNINEILTDVIHLIENKRITESALNRVRIKIATKLEFNSKVEGDSTEIREVFINLINNSIDAMPQGGKIEILSKNTDDNYVLVEIRDNGIGMNEETQKRIFEPFFTTKGEGGSGLGLSVSYKIIQSYGGTIEVESEENLGTAFKIKLPICKKEENTIKEVNTNKDIDFTGNVLVIDDKENIRNVVGDMIKSICECKVKKINGESIEKIERELQKRKYNIVISDFSMPNLNGIEVAQSVKKVNKDTYFCLMTGWIGDFYGSCMEYIDKILYKPINKDKMKELLLEYNNR